MNLRLRHIPLIGIFFLCSFFPVAAQYAVNGSANQISCNCYRLTPDANNQSGSVWNLNQIDLSNPFDYYFDVFLGCSDAGADGLAFVLQPISTTVGGGGGGLGYAGISPSIAVEIDTYQNSGASDPGVDHISIMRNGDVNHGSGNNLAGPVQASSSSGNVEDCTYHVLRVTWNPGTNTLTAYFDGVMRVSYTGNIIATPFGGNPNVYWGFTAGTGGARNEHRFCVNINPSFSIDPSTNCVGVPTGFTDNSYSTLGQITSWSWNFGDGNTSSLQNPSHTYASAGNYTVTLTVADINSCTATSTTTVTVNPSPVASAGADVSICEGSSTTLGASGGSFYQWSPTTGLSDEFASNPVANPVVTTTYTVTVIDGNTCQATDDVVVTVNPLPFAIFSANDECLGNNIQFNDQSTVSSGSITQWAWDFGDGNTSSLQNPVHAYAVAGTYTVSLSVTTNNNCSGSTTSQVNVFDLPVADFSFTDQCDGTSIQFTDLSSSSSGNINQWNWDFYGLAQDVAQNPSYLFPGPGSYDVDLVVTTDNSCSSSVTHQVIIFPNPVADFTATDVCFGNQTDFTDASSVSSGTIDSWAWDFGDSNTSAIQSPANNYAAANTYTVMLTVTTNNQCTATQSHDVNVSAVPVAGFNFSDVCQASAAQFTDASTIAAGAINSWSWDFGDSQTSTVQNPSNNYATAGTYTVSLTVSSGAGCTDQTQQDIVIHPMPVADFTGTSACEGYATDFTDQSSVSSGTVAGWNWNFGDSNTSNLQNPSNVYASFGNYNTSLTATTDNGCTNTIILPVTVFASPAPDFTVADVCHNSPSVFTNTSTIGQGSFSATLWDFDDGLTSTQTSPQHTYVLPNTYDVTLTVTSNNGCTESLTKPAVVFPNPEPVFTSTPEIGCMPLDVQFTDMSTIASGIITGWEWEIENAGIFTTPDLGYIFPSPGQYDVALTVTSDKGCEITRTENAFVTVHPKPVPAFSFTPKVTEILYPEITFTDLSVGSPTEWNWDFGNTDISDEQHPVYSYPDTGKYIVTLVVFNQYGCSDTVEHEVIITPSFTIYVPTAFTPDGDGMNDVFLPRGIGWRDYELRVFSRSGTQVFSSFDPDTGWNGRMQNLLEFVKPDVYVWRVYVRDKNNRVQDFKGTVSLIR